MLCCLNIYCDGNEGNPVNPDTARRCQYCKQSLIPLLRNRFKPLKVLGQGGFGRTYLAEDQDNLNSYCVLKQLMPQGGSKAVELFQREAQQLQTLGQDNPQIPSLIAFFSENNALFLVQQFIEGTSLQKELDNQGTWQAAAVIQFLKEILPILQFIHQRSVIHRDIKPDNIMRRRDTGQIVLIDFGLSKSMKGSVLALPGTRAGSYGYVPLEQMEDGEAYPASDLFSLGATCFHLLSGIYPHSLWLRQGYGWVNNWQSHISQPLPPALTRVLDKLLREEYTRRYQSAQDVLNRLNAPGDNAPGQPPPPTFQPDPVPPVKTRPTVVAVPPQAAKRPVQPNPPVKVPPSPQKRAVAVPPQPIKRPVQPNPPVKATPSPQNQSLPAADWQTLLLWLVALGGSYGLLSLYQVGQEALFVAVFSDPDDVSGATSLTRIFWLGGGLSWDSSPVPSRKNRMRLYLVWLGLWLWLWLSLWLGISL